ncbi:hydrogenase maturation protease [Sporichthya brevicatena]|uniref:Hydrogenase maturation protease n=1 Tax=Sporichthya brevicatena TaxID=171442 RepID=A0ABP3RRT2_9ACTN
MSAPAPHELLDDGFAPPPCEVVIIGCGNLLRADDSVGPRVIRLLWSSELPEQVRLVDGGTAGMDVAFQMRGARRVVIVDASNTGAAPGTVYRVPGAELAHLPSLPDVHTHAFRWDNALALGRWLLGPEFPEDITVFLVEAANVAPGEHLTPAVEQAMHAVAETLREEFVRPYERTVATVELTGNAYLRMDAQLARRYFPSGVCTGLREGSDVLLVPLHAEANGGLVLKERNPAGDRAVLLREVLGNDAPVGVFPVEWDAARGLLRIDLSPEVMPARP